MAIIEPYVFGLTIVGIVAIIVLNDLWRIRASHNEVPKLGELENGGFAWATKTEEEVLRDIPGIITLGVMMALPWFLSQKSGTPSGLVIIFDILLALHILGMISPKRYAITSTHLHVDGHSIPWSALRPSKRQRRGRIVLQRNGWWFFAPLALGGGSEDLLEATNRIAEILIAKEEE